MSYGLGRLLYLGWHILFPLFLCLGSHTGCRFFRLTTSEAPAQSNVWAADYPDVGGIILLDEGVLSYRVDEIAEKMRLVTTIKRKRRVQVLRPKGVSLAQFDIPFDDYSSVINIRGRIIDSKGRTQGMQPGSSKHRPLRAYGKKAPELGVVQVRLPKPAIGDIIEYEYEQVFTIPELAPPWIFRNALPTLRSQFTIVSEPGIRVDYVYGQGVRRGEKEPQRRIDEDKRERLIFVEMNLPPAYPESDSVSPMRFSPWVAAVVQSAQIGETKKRLDNWIHVAERLWRWFRQTNQSGPKTRGNIVMRFNQIQNGLKIADIRGLGGIAPRNRKAIARGYVISPRDAAAILARHLQRLGLNAYPVLVNTQAGPPLIRSFPSFFPFERIIVAVEAQDVGIEKGKCKRPPLERDYLCGTPSNGYVFLDPGCRYCQFGQLPEELYGGIGLLITKISTKWIDIPAPRIDNNYAFHRYQIKMNPYGRLQGKLASQATGSFANHVRRGYKSFGVQAPEVILAPLLWLPQEMRFRQFEVEKPERSGGGFRMWVKFTHELEKHDLEAYEMRLHELIGYSWGQRMRRKRETGRLVKGPYGVDTLVSLQIPREYKIRSPRNTNILNDFGRYQLKWHFVDSTLTVERRFQMTQAYIAPHQWPEFFAFQQEIKDLEQEVHLVKR